MKLVVLTTSYPRYEGDPAGNFIHEGVEHLRRRGIEVEVVGPGSFRHYGIAYGDGVVGNLRRRPARALLLPPMLWSFARAARRAARDADLVQAHWLGAGAVAMACGRPFVVRVEGTDVELARRAPLLARPVLRAARLVLSVSTALAEAARALGAREVRVVGNGVELPPFTRDPVEPPEILFVGRLSREKGILELLEAAEGLPLTVVGDGPLRDRVPQAVGIVPHGELGSYYERAAVVAMPSRREGFGIVCAEAMAHARPVVASAVGGLTDLVVDGETGLLVPPGDIGALRAALERMLADANLRRQLGQTARERVGERFSWDVVTGATIAAYEEALRL
ncbi:MAG: glycosyltransferase family 4 protein [Gaiellaceae bacterium]